MTPLRKTLLAEVRALSPNARGRRAFEKALLKATNLELIAATGIKPRIRVKAHGVRN